MNYLVIDIGGTRTKSAIIDDKGKISKKNNVRTPKTYKELLNYIELKYKENNIDSNIIGLSCPGIYSLEKKIITGSSALSYLINKNIVEDIENLLINCKVIIENDGNCALLGELYTEDYTNSKNILMLVIGSAIGGSAIVNGKLILGENSNAAEFGYMMVDNNVIESEYHSVGGMCGINGLISLAKDNGYNINDGFELFEEMLNNKSLYKLIKRRLRYLAISIINLQYILDPSVILIGGGISKNKEFINIIRENIEEIMILRKNYKVRPTIKPAKKGNDANLFGIAYKCRRFNLQTK